MNGSECYAVALSEDETKLFTGEDDSLVSLSPSSGSHLSSLRMNPIYNISSIIRLESKDTWLLILYWSNFISLLNSSSLTHLKSAVLTNSPSNYIYQFGFFNLSHIYLSSLQEIMLVDNSINLVWSWRLSFCDPNAPMSTKSQSSKIYFACRSGSTTSFFGALDGLGNQYFLRSADVVIGSEILFWEILVLQNNLYLFDATEKLVTVFNTTSN